MDRTALPDQAHALEQPPVALINGKDGPFDASVLRLRHLGSAWNTDHTEV